MPPFDPRAELNLRIKRAKSLRALARQWDVSLSYLHGAANGTYTVGPKILERMGYETKVVRRRVPQ